MVEAKTTEEKKDTAKAASMISDLVALQSELPSVAKDSSNPAFRSKYASLDAITEAVFPVMTKHNFAWVTRVFSDNESYKVVYELMHVSGESIKGHINLQLQKRDMQGLGSAITYARRYCLSSVLGIVTDEDDDGNAASGTKSDEPHVKISSGGKPTEKQIGFAKKLLIDHNIVTSNELKGAYKAFAGVNADHLEDLDKAQLSGLIDALNSMTTIDIQARIIENMEGVS